jgi:hypothetical protein
LEAVESPPSSKPQGEVIPSSSSSNKPQGTVISDAEKVTQAPALCVLNNKLVTYLGEMDGKKVYTSPHEKEVETVDDKHIVKGNLPPTSTPRGKKRKYPNLFPGWTQVKFKKNADNLYCDQQKTSIWKGKFCMKDAKFIVVKGVGGVLVRDDEYNRLRKKKKLQ